MTRAALYVLGAIAAALGLRALWKLIARTYRRQPFLVMASVLGIAQTISDFI